mmetsp:Transcript_106938/g.319764  ORF Transcript_106938/g.319764 Transcript_106938/m.319764 type:complete len:425 (+) Transcript_106938:335-1609(+)
MPAVQSRVANVVEWRDCFQLVLDAVSHTEAVDERVDALLRHRLVGPCELLQRFVRIWVLLTPQDALQRLGDDNPIALEVSPDGRLIDQQLPEPTLDGRERYCGVPERDPQIPQDRGVGEVALQSAHGQLLRQMLEDRVGHAEVALSVLKVNRVDLVRHGAGPDLSCHDLLLEVLHGDIHPDVAAHVHEDGVDALHRIENGAHVIVVLNLRGVLLPLQPKARLAELICEGPPVDVLVRHQVGIHVPCGPPKLARVRDLPQEPELSLQTLDEDLELLREVRRRGRLPMGLGEHRHVPLRQLPPQRLQEPLQAGNKPLLERVLQEQGRRRVVDVLAGQRKVHILLEGLQAQGVELLLDEVLHGLDIVVGDLLRCLDLAGIFKAQVGRNSPQLRHPIGGEVLAGRQLLHEGEEILNLNVHAVPDEAIL